MTANEAAVADPVQPPDQQVVQAFLSALERMDAEAALALLDADAVYQNVPLPPDRGVRSIERTLRTMLRFVSHFEARMHHIAATDGVVLTERTDILRGPWLDLEFWVRGTFEVREGKITLWRDYFDVPTFAFQLVTSPLRTLFGARRHA